MRRTGNTVRQHQRSEKQSRPDREAQEIGKHYMQVFPELHPTDRMITSSNMMNSTERMVSDALGELLIELQSNDAINEISERIDRAFQSFGLTQTEIVSHRRFIETITDFIKHMYEHSLCVPRPMTKTAALSEGLDLLERYYESDGTRGFEAAYLDVSEESGRGIEFVLRQLAEIIKEREVSRYSNSRFHLAIDPTDGEAHMRIVKFLADRYGPMPPINLTQERPWRFAKHYRDLIEIVVSTEQFFTQIRNSSITSSGA